MHHAAPATTGTAVRKPNGAAAAALAAPSPEDVAGMATEFIVAALGKAKGQALTNAKLSTTLLTVLAGTEHDSYRNAVRTWALKPANLASIDSVLVGEDLCAVTYDPTTKVVALAPVA